MCCAGKVIFESRETDEWYEYFDDFASLLNHPKSFVRSRALTIIAANARWDEGNKFDGILPDYLSHITDEKSITARQCIKAPAQIGQVKPQYIPEIVSTQQKTDMRTIFQTRAFITKYTFPMRERSRLRNGKLLLDILRRL